MDPLTNIVPGYGNSEQKGKLSSDGITSYGMVAVAEMPLENYNEQGLLYAAKNFDKSKTLYGATSYSATAPILHVRNMGGSGDRILVIQELTLFVQNTPGAATEIITALDVQNRYSSGGNKNTNLYALNSIKSNPSNMEVYEGNSGAAIVASAGEGNQIHHGIYPAAPGTRIELAKDGEIILGAQNHVLLVYGFAGSTLPQFFYKLVWSER